MHRRVANFGLRRGLRPDFSRVFNSLNTTLLGRAASIGPCFSSGVRYGHGDSSAEGTENVQAKDSSDLPPGSEDIIVGDLAATLEAHRASNRTRAQDENNTLSPEGQGGRDETSGEATFESLAREKHNSWGATTLTKAIGNSELSPAGPYPLVRFMRGQRSRSQKSHDGPGNKQDKSRYLNVEHEAESLRAQGRWVVEVGTRPPRPWLKYLDSDHKDLLDRLSSEIRALEAYMRQTPAEQASANHVISDAMSALKGEFARDEIKQIGPQSTDLANPLSSFDFRIVPRAVESGDPIEKGQLEKNSSDTMDDILQRTEQRLQIDPAFKDVRRLYAGAHIVRAIHCDTRCRLDFQAMHRSQASQDQIVVWHRDIPSLHPLFTTMRLFLDTLRLNRVVSGGIGSFVLLVMIVTALKHADTVHDPDDLGGQLLHVLAFWGWADLQKYAYSAEPPTIYNKTGEWVTKWAETIAKDSQASSSQLAGMVELCRRQNNEAYRLCLQGPAEHEYDLGKHSYKIELVQAVFRLVHQRMSNLIAGGRANDSISKMQLARSDSEQYRSVLNEMIRADFREFEELRRRLEKYADLRRRGKNDGLDETSSHERPREAVESQKGHASKAPSSTQKVSPGNGSDVQSPSISADANPALQAEPKGATRGFLIRKTLSSGNRSSTPKSPIHGSEHGNETSVPEARPRIRAFRHLTFPKTTNPTEQG